jgi:hypothetical protein
MLRSAQHLRRGALLIRGPSIWLQRGSRLCEAAQARRIASGTHWPQFEARFGGEAGHDLISVS